MDIRQSLQYAEYLRREGWFVKRIREINYFIKKFPLIGSVLKLQRPEKIDFNTIDRLCRKYRVFQIIIEPDLALIDSSVTHNLLLHNGFKITRSPYLPSKTLQIDLTQTKKRIYTNFTKDCKYSIKRAMALSERSESKGSDVTIHEYSTLSDIKTWRESWKKSVKFTRYVPSEQQLLNLCRSFPHNYSVFLASHNGSTSSPQVISGAIFLRTKDVAYYWYAFTNDEGRTSLSQYSLLWKGLLWAKKMGCKVFDFEGIYNPRFPNKSWLGFSHFKRSFGGRGIEYPGCYTKFRLPV